MPEETTDGLDPDSIINKLYSGDSNVEYYLENYEVEEDNPIKKLWDAWMSTSTGPEREEMGNNLFRSLVEAENHDVNAGLVDFLKLAGSAFLKI